MNLETIQSRVQDIQQMRLVSQENEKKLLYGKGRRRTDSDDIGASTSSLSFRFFMAIVVLVFFIYFDYNGFSEAGELLDKVSDTISYNIRLEDVENLEEIWYTITDTLCIGKRGIYE